MSASITFTYQDEKGKLSSTSVNIPVSTAIADMTAFAIGMAQLLTPLTRGSLTNVSICIGLDVSAMTGVNLGPPWAGRDVEEGGRFQFQTAGGYSTSLRVPTFYEPLVLPNSDEIDQTDPDVAAFVAAMETGITLPSTNVVQPCDTRADDVTTLQHARETFQSSGRRRR